MISNAINSNKPYLSTRKIENNLTISNEVKLLENSRSLKIGIKAKNLKIIKKKAGCLISKTLVINTDIFSQLLINNKISYPLNYNWFKF